MRSMSRHKFTAVFTVFLTCVAIAVISLTTLTILNLKSIEPVLLQSSDLKIVLKDPSYAGAVLGRLAQYHQVHSDVITPYEGMIILEKEMGNGGLLSIINKNPLPEVINVSGQPQTLLLISKWKGSGIAGILYNHATLSSLGQMLDIIKNSLYVLFVVAAGFVVVMYYFITKQTIFSRKSDIDTMELLGAGFSSISTPLVFESMLLGLIGSLLSSVLVLYGYTYTIPKIHSALPFWPIVSEPVASNYIVPISIFVSLLFGAVGSLMASVVHIKRSTLR